MGVPQAGHHLRSAQAPCPPPEGPTCLGQSPRFSPFVSRPPPTPVPRLRHGQLGSYLSARTFGFLNERDPSVFACLCLSYLLSIIPWGSIPLVQRARFLSFFSLFFGGPHSQQGSCGQRRSDHGGPCPPFRISVFISFEETPRSGMAGPRGSSGPAISGGHAGPRPTSGARGPSLPPCLSLCGIGPSDRCPREAGSLLTHTRAAPSALCAHCRSGRSGRVYVSELRRASPSELGTAPRVRRQPCAPRTALRPAATPSRGPCPHGAPRVRFCPLLLLQIRGIVTETDVRDLATRVPFEAVPGLSRGLRFSRHLGRSFARCRRAVRFHAFARSCLSGLLTVAFTEQKFSISIKANLSVSSPTAYNFAVVSKKPLPNPRSQSFVRRARRGSRAETVSSITCTQVKMTGTWYNVLCQSHHHPKKK